MRRILLNMQNFLFADAISNALRREQSDFDVHTESDPNAITDKCRWLLPYALLLEVTGYSPWLLDERIRIIEEVKNRNRECKAVIVVDENADKEIALKVRQAKKDGLIDNFVFGSISSAYLTAVIDTL